MSHSARRCAFITCVLSLAPIIIACAQETGSVSLENIWRAIWTESGKVLSAEAELAADKIQQRLAVNTYFPTLKAKSGRTQNVGLLEDEGSWFGDWSAEASIQQSIPGGGTLSISGDDALSDIEFYDACRRLQYPSFSIGFSQSLFPFWLDKGSRDPVIEGPTLRVKEGYVALHKTRRDLALKAAESYIALRRNERQIQYLEQSAARAGEKLKSQKEQQAHGAVSIRETWDVENELWNIKKQLLEAKASAAEQRQEFSQLIGVEIDDVLSPPLPQLPLSSTQGGKSIEAEELLVALQEERSSFVAQRQKGAPILEVNFKRAFLEKPVGWDDTYDTEYSLSMKDYWSLYLGVTFPTSFFSDRQIIKELEGAYDRKYDSLLMEQSRAIASRRELYKVHESGLGDQRIGALDELSRVEKVNSDAETMIKDGQISELEAWQTRLEVLRARADVEDLNDQLWLTSLYIASLNGWTGEERTDE